MRQARWDGEGDGARSVARRPVINYAIKYWV
jgi:hypothetical protein